MAPTGALTSCSLAVPSPQRFSRKASGSAKSSIQGGVTSTAASTGALATGATSVEEPSVADLGKNESGDTSLPDSQYAILSLVAIAYFIGALIKNLNGYASHGGVIKLPRHS